MLFLAKTWVRFPAPILPSSDAVRRWLQRKSPGQHKTLLFHSPPSLSILGGMNLPSVSLTCLLLASAHHPGLLHPPPLTSLLLPCRDFTRAQLHCSSLEIWGSHRDYPPVALATAPLFVPWPGAWALGHTHTIAESWNKLIHSLSCWGVLLHFIIIIIIKLWSRV